jgi:hypothetical protein
MKVFVLIVIVSVIVIYGCSKPDDSVPTPPPPPPTPTSPTGTIKEFFLLDTIVPFNKGTTAKWSVAESNDKTIVSFNGVKVTLYGVLETGRLQQTTTFTLSVNSGAKQSKTVKVYDSITTYMWNEGKRWKQVNFESFEKLTGLPDSQWVAHMTDTIANERTSYFLNGDSKIEQLKPAFGTPGPSGKFVVYLDKNKFSWKGILYSIVILDKTDFKITYETTQLNGAKLRQRNTYIFE